MIDNHGRNINYLRVSVTERCNLRCIYCMPKDCASQSSDINHLSSKIDSQSSDINHLSSKIDNQSSEIDHFNSEEIFEIVKAASVLGISKIRYTGGEPLLYDELNKLIYETSRLSGINKIGITTNGLLLCDRINELKNSGLNSVNISLDSLDEEQYKRITRGGDLHKVLRSIEQCISLGLQSVKVNTVLLKGINDHEVWKLMDLTRELPIEIRFIELMPLGEGIKLYKNCNISTDQILDAYPHLIPIESEKGSTARIYKMAGAKGKIGFINPMSNKFCSDCNKIRLTSTGAIKPCLHSKEEINIREYISDKAALSEVMREAIYHKPSEHRINEEKVSRSISLMHQIGG